MQKDQQVLKISKSFISGGIAGCVNKTIIAPVQRIKYLFLTTNKKFTYKQFFYDLKYVIKNNGILDLWRGNSMNIARVFPHGAINFAVFDYLRDNFYHHSKEHEIKESFTLFMFGSVAGTTSLIFTFPLQFVRVRMVMERQAYSYSNIQNAFTVIFKNEGFFGFYKGFIAALCGIAIYQGFSFSIFAKGKEKLHQKKSSLPNQWFIDFMLGGLSAFGQIIAYPFEIIRKRMQGQNLLLTKGQIDKVLSYKQLIHQIYTKQENMKGFFKGISLNLIKAPLGMANLWMIKNYLNRRLNQSYDL